MRFMVKNLTVRVYKTAKYTRRYLKNLPVPTSKRNTIKLTFKTPAATVNGSPMTGTHENKRLNTPNVLNRVVAFKISGSVIRQNL